MSQIAVHTLASRCPKRREQRRREAAARNAESASFTPQERLTVLDDRFGKGQGAQRERLRLTAKIAGGKVHQPEDLIEEPSEPGQPLKRTRAKDRRAAEKKMVVRQ
jgi:hypothetical protein